jgi:hypothetical protein
MVRTRTRKNKKLKEGGSVFSHEYVDLDKIKVGTVLTIKDNDKEMNKQIKEIINKMNNEIYENTMDDKDYYINNLLRFLFLLKIKKFKITKIQDRGQLMFAKFFISPEIEKEYTEFSKIINNYHFQYPGKPFFNIVLDVREDRKIKIDSHGDLKLYKSGIDVEDSGIDLEDSDDDKVFIIKKSAEEGGSKSPTRKKRKYHKK